MAWHYILAKTKPRILKYQRLTAHPHAATVEDQFGLPTLPSGTGAHHPQGGKQQPFAIRRRYLNDCMSAIGVCIRPGLTIEARG